jgi:hypothetical protein
MRTVKWALALAVAFGGALASVGDARAQSTECSKLQGLLQERQALIARMNSGGKKSKMTPQAACSVLGQVVANGNKVVAFIEGNKDWCQIPDQFAEGIKADHSRAASFRGQACRAAAQQATAERKAREAQQRGAQGGFGGGDSVVGGGWRIPQGAL